MKDLENHHIGHGEPLRHADEPKDAGSHDYGMDAVRSVSAFGCIIELLVIAFLLLLTTCSCTPKTVTIREEVPVYLHDTLTNTIVRIDSLVERDSIYFETFIKGDTVSLTKYVEKWRTKTDIKHDTIIHEIEVPITYTECTEVEVEVPAKLTKWQRFAQGLGNLTFFLSIAAVAVYLWRKFGR